VTDCFRNVAGNLIACTGDVFPTLRKQAVAKDSDGAEREC
jgi:hypothetical protein